MTTQNFRGITYTVQTITGDGQSIEGTPGNDWIEAPGSNNKIETGKGNDVILAGVKFEGLSPNYPPYGGEDIGIISAFQAKNSTTRIDAGSGDDYVAVGRENYTVDLGNGNNIFDGSITSGNIHVSAGNGNDIIDAEGVGNYQVDAGGGDNKIYLAAGNASISAGSGNDVISITELGIFSSLSPYFFPEEGSPGQPYKQVIDAGNGDNQVGLTVFGQTNISTGSGNDFVLARSLSPFIGGTVNSDTVNIDTGSGNDTVITIDTKSSIKTGAGDDLIVAGAGDDIINPGSGRNTINLRGGTSSIPSSLNDLVSSSLFGLDNQGVTVQGGGKDTVYLDGGQDTIILGSGGSATIYGFSKNDLLDLNGLNAALTRNGSDTLIKSGSTVLGVLKGYTGSVGLA